LVFVGAAGDVVVGNALGPVVGAALAYLGLVAVAEHPVSVVLDAVATTSGLEAGGDVLGGDGGKEQKLFHRN
jgi:hypothetical protein